MSLIMTRVVHASVLFEIGGHTVLTDPWFSEKPGYYHGEPVGVPLEKLPKLSAVVVSHGHYDHYDMDAFRQYPDKTVPMFVRKGTAEKARSAGFTNVREMDFWESAAVGDLRITAAPAKHGVPENTYVLESAGSTVFFGGDTLLIPEFQEVAQRFPSIDLAVLAINGLRIRPLLNRKVVMSGKDAADLCALLRPKVAVPYHYAFHSSPSMDRFVLGYDGRTGSPEAFLRLVNERSPETRVKILSPGERFIVNG